jgi:ADP-glucose type glycogen/starch synthase
MADPRILIVTPEISYLPGELGKLAAHMRAKAGGLADVSSSLVKSLYEAGADVHVALPNYRRLFDIDPCQLQDAELRHYHSKLPSDRVHLAEDRVFYFRDHVYSAYSDDNVRCSLVFQREVINNIIPHVRPDIVHCNDWMTGLIPAVTRRMGIPSLFTLHNIHTVKVLLEHIEDTGIDTSEFWQNLYYQLPPASYEQTRSSNPVDMLTSGIFAAHWVNTVSPSFLEEITHRKHPSIPAQVCDELHNKQAAGFASGITNAPDPSYDPSTDQALACQFTADNYAEGKLCNRRSFQEQMDLDANDDAAILFWPSRLDPMQKGPELLTDILAKLVNKHRQQGIQIAFVADGSHAHYIKQIISTQNLHGIVSIKPFDENLSRLGFAASDFMLMPSKFEPCGLTQMIALKYGSLPIVHRTGGLKDTVEHLNTVNSQGNGFVFNDYVSDALEWTIQCAIDFHHLPPAVKQREIRRIMRQANSKFTHQKTASHYINLYEEMLGKPLHAEEPS